MLRVLVVFLSLKCVQLVFSQDGSTSKCDQKNLLTQHIANDGNFYHKLIFYRSFAFYPRTIRCRRNTRWDCHLLLQGIGRISWYTYRVAEKQSSCQRPRKPSISSSQVNQVVKIRYLFYSHFLAEIKNKPEKTSIIIELSNNFKNWINVKYFGDLDKMNSNNCISLWESLSDHKVANHLYSKRYFLLWNLVMEAWW